jgi:hypothetical protein
VTEPPSFEKINYSIRPAKATQRRMLVEALGRLTPIDSLSKYQYIGFGSTFFLDFKMIHRQYGIKKLTSVERERDKRPRFDFNKPFSCIDMYYGTAAEFFISERIDWDRRAIIWLDYDYRMDGTVLADIDRVAESARPGSLLLVTVDAQLPKANERQKLLEEELELSKLLEWVGGKMSRLGDWGLAHAYWGHAKTNLESTLRKRRPECKWHQLFNFHYQDGHKMLTFGGLLVDEEVKKVIKQCRFKELPYFRPQAEALEIAVPNLTEPEMHKLAQRMPNLTKRNRKPLTRLAIEDVDIDNYRLLYRYLPRFIESQA